MHVGGGPMLGFGSTWRIHQWLNLSELNLIVLNFGFKTYLAFLSLRVCLKVEGFRDCWDLQTRIMKLFISFLVLKFVITLESHISLD